MIFSDSCNPKSITHLFIKLLEATSKNEILISIYMIHTIDIGVTTVIQFQLVKSAEHQKIIFRAIF